MVEDFVQVSGVALPSKVILGHRASDKPGGSKQSYTLQSVKINEEVDPSSVLLPRGVALTDYRFGEEQGVPYVIKDGLLLSDEQVKQLLGERSQTKAAGLAPSQQTVNHTPLMLMGGLRLIQLRWRDVEKRLVQREVIPLQTKASENSRVLRGFCCYEIIYTNCVKHLSLRSHKIVVTRA